MELSEQCVSLELAKRLKELGVRQESLFYWTKIFNADDKLEFHLFFNKNEPFEMVSAFTIAELGEMLPSHRIYTQRYFKKDAWRCKDSFKIVPIMQETTEANARAKMLIYLIENKLIEVPMVKRQ